MKELNYQYKIIEEKIINGTNILKIKDDIYNKIIFMEIYKITKGNNWDESNQAEQEMGKLKDDGIISDYFVNDDYSSEIKTFYKIFETYDGFEDKEDKPKTEEKVFKEDFSTINKSNNLVDSLTDGIELDNSYTFKKIHNEPDITKNKADNYNKPNNNAQKSEVKMNSYTTKNNQDEINRINELKKSREAIYNTYSKYPESSPNSNKKSSKMGLIFFFIIIGIVYAVFFIPKAHDEEAYKYHKNKYSNNDYKTNYKKGIDYSNRKLYLSAEQSFKKSCNYDKNKQGCSMLGDIYEENKIYKKNRYKLAVEYYIKGCELNDSYSCKQAGYLSRKKLKDNKYAIKYDKKGCDLNNNFSCAEVGYIYDVAFDSPKEAIPFYKKACKLNNKIGCYNLALIYHFDKVKGIKNIKKAKELYAKSCKLGYKIACSVKFDTSPKKDDIKTETSDDPKELFKLAWKYQDKKEYYSANLYFSKACTKGHLASCNNIGYNYLNGYGYSKSTMMAKKYFSETCEKNNGYGCNQIGYFYETGTEFKKNLKQARVFYKKSCNLNYALACSNLAKLYQNGNGVKTDKRIARILFRKSCKLGYKKACK